MLVDRAGKDRVDKHNQSRDLRNSEYCLLIKNKAEVAVGAGGRGESVYLIKFINHRVWGFTIEKACKYSLILDLFSSL